MGVSGSSIAQGLTIDKYGVKNSGAKYEAPSTDTKVTTYQVSGRNSVEVIANADPTTTVTLPEIVTGTPGANQVGIGYVFHLSIDRSVAVTINRAGADLMYVDGVSVTATAITTNATQYFIRTFRATDANKWEVTPGNTGATISEYNVAVSGANSGSNLRIKATGTGVTASYASNKLTVVIPSGTKVFSADWRLVSADIQASADAAGTTNWVLAEFQGTGGNTSVDDLRVPNIQKTSIPTSGALSVTNSGSVDIDNNPAISVVGAASGNIIIRVGGLSAGGQGYHLKFTEL
jgi:hypothetical protein